jgi:hypothetical protein
MNTIVTNEPKRAHDVGHSFIYALQINDSLCNAAIAAILPSEGLFIGNYLETGFRANVAFENPIHWQNTEMKMDR